MNARLRCCCASRPPALPPAPLRLTASAAARCRFPSPLLSRPLPAAAGEVYPGDYCQSLERAELVREGTDVSIFCYSRMRYVVMQAVAQLEKEGYNPEVRPPVLGGGGVCVLCEGQAAAEGAAAGRWWKLVPTLRLALGPLAPRITSSPLCMPLPLPAGGGPHLPEAL